MLRMLLSVAQPGGGTMRAALRYLHDQPAPVPPEQLLQDGLPACTTAAQYAAFQLMGQRQLMSLCHATEAASGAAALQQFVDWLATMLDQAHGQASPAGMLSPAPSTSSGSDEADCTNLTAGAAAPSHTADGSRPETMLARLMAALASEIPDLFTGYSFKPPRGTLPIIATSSAWRRYQRLVASFSTRHELLAAQAAEQHPDACLLDAIDPAPLRRAVGAFDGALHMNNGMAARKLGTLARFQVARQLQLCLGQPLEVETTDHQADHVARAAGVASPAAAAAAGVPWLPGLAQISIHVLGRAGSCGQAVRGWHQFARAASASDDQLLLCEGDLLRLARQLADGGHSAGDCWQQMLQRLETGGLAALDEHISVSFVEPQGLAATLGQLHMC